LDIQVVPTLDLVATQISCRDCLVEKQRLEKGGEPLLTIKDQAFWLWRIGQTDAFNEAWFEADIGIASLKHHHSANGVRQGNAGKQAPNVFIIPHPAALKIGELSFAVTGTSQQIEQ
jgi:hypothetical protein